MFVRAIIVSFLAVVGANPVSIDKRAIPVHKTGCFTDIIVESDLVLAMKKLEFWGEKYKIDPAAYHGEVQQHTAAWICNCKYFAKDHVVGAELDEARDRVRGECGDLRGGFVYSKKWQKSLAFGSERELNSEMYGEKCPQFCVWKEG